MRIILVSTLLLIVGCSSRAEEKSAQQSESEHLVASKPNGLIEKKGAMDTLSFDWPKLKTAVRFLNCGSRNNTEKRYLQAPKQGQFYYGYCAHNGNQEKTRQINTLPSDSKLIEVIVIKTDGEIGQYTAKNETFQFLQTQIASDDLGTLNWVGKDRSTVMGAFGKPEKDSLNTLCYTGSGGTLILKLSDADTVTALKYYPNRNGESIEIETLNW